MNKTACLAVDLDRKERRRRAILDAAFDLFLEHGYSNVSMSDVIRRSGGSLATAYSLFCNKAGLLQQLVIDRCIQHGREVEEVTAAEGSPEEVLRKTAWFLYDKLLTPQAVGLLRIIVAQSQLDPAFGANIARTGPQLAQNGLAETFRRWDREGLLDVDDSGQAADSFLALLLHHVQMRALCGLAMDLDPAAIEQHIDNVVRTICSRYQCEAKAAQAPRA